MSMANDTSGQTWKHSQHAVTMTITNPPQVTGALVACLPNRRRFYVGDSGARTERHRIPEIDIRLAKLQDAAKFIAIGSEKFWHLHGDVAVDVLGFYNPIYSGRPKKIAQMLLDILPGCKRREWSLVGCGLAYPIPGLAGIRSERMRVSAAGLALLDHWAKTYPKFAAFLAPYDSKKARETITSHCFDMAMGHRPSDFRKIDEANVLNQLKADSRELKRLKRQAEASAQEIRTMQQVLLIHQQQMAHQQQQAVENGYRNGRLTPLISGTADTRIPGLLTHTKPWGV